VGRLGNKELRPGIGATGQCRTRESTQADLHDQFLDGSECTDKAGELKQIGTSWARESFIRGGKWAEIGNEQVTSVVDACADALYKL
jgi:hypothetical protein